MRFGGGGRSSGGGGSGGGGMFVYHMKSSCAIINMLVKITFVCALYV